MRRKIVAVLIGVMLGSSICGCGSQEKTYTQSEVDQMMKDAGKGTESDSEEADKDNADNENADTEDADSTAAAADSENEKTTDEAESKNTVATDGLYRTNESFTMFESQPELEETVILDQDDVKITVTGISYNNSPSVTVQFENNTDKNLKFHTGTIGYGWGSVNGYMAGGFLNEEIAAGKKANAKLTLQSDELMMLGIRDLSEFQIGFEIEDDDYKDYIRMEPVTVKLQGDYDYSEEAFVKSITNQYIADEVGFDLEYLTEDTLFDSNDIKVNVAAVVATGKGEEALMLEMENTGKKPLVASTCDIALNGIRLSNGTWENTPINPGKKAVSLIKLESVIPDELVSMADFSEIGEISLGIEVKDESYDSIADPERITITVPDRNTSTEIAGTEVYDGNGIKLYSVGKIDDASEYSGDVHMFFLVENTGSENRGVDVSYKGNAVNGFVVDISAYSIEVEPGEKGIIDAWIWDYNKEDCEIEKADDITSVDLALDFRDKDWHSVGEDMVSFEYK